MINEHNLVLGPVKASKNQMLSGIEDIIIVDPKGDLSETVEKTLESKGYEICTFDFSKKEACHYDLSGNDPIFAEIVKDINDSEK